MHEFGWLSRDWWTDRQRTGRKRVVLRVAHKIFILVRFTEHLFYGVKYFLSAVNSVVADAFAPIRSFINHRRIFLIFPLLRLIPLCSLFSIKVVFARSLLDPSRRHAEPNTRARAVIMIRYRPFPFFRRKQKMTGLFHFTFFLPRQSVSSAKWRRGIVYVYPAQKLLSYLQRKLAVVGTLVEWFARKTPPRIIRQGSYRLRRSSKISLTLCFSKAVLSLRRKAKLDTGVAQVNRKSVNLKKCDHEYIQSDLRFFLLYVWSAV